MVTDSMRRRQALTRLSQWAGAGLAGAWMVADPAAVLAAPGEGSGPAATPPGSRAGAASTAPIRLAAAWAVGAQHQVGVLQAHGDALTVRARLDTPTRAHGLWLEPGGTLLSVARRPGDWLLRWRADGRPLAWCWIEPARAFNGHALMSPDGHRLYTTETDLETGAGLIGVRDGRSLRKIAEWPTQGMDPHEMAWQPGAAGQRLVVANGGIPTLPETGRLKIGLARMDSSLVLLDAARGDMVGQWRLPDPRLSLRHLAWHTGGPRPVLGIALQGEHDDPQTKAQSPLLGLWDGERLRTADAAPMTLSGYGGDIATTPEGFAVSAPKAGTVALWRSDGRWAQPAPLPQACALADGAGRLWMGGEPGVLQRQAGAFSSLSKEAALRLDNHWLVI